MLTSFDSHCPDFNLLRLASRTNSLTNSTGSLHVLALQEELADVKERNIKLAARLQQKEDDLKEATEQLEMMAKEKVRI